MKLRVLFLLCSAILFTSSIPAQQSEPAWLLMERGKVLFNENKLGEALLIFRQCLERKGLYPEADHWIGKVYEAEGEYDLALKQYDKALLQEKYLYTYQEAIELQYEMASIYKKTKQYQLYENQLLEITYLNPEFEDTEYLEYQQGLMNSLTNFGLSKTLTLYRLSVKSSLSAHRQLGIHYYKNGRYYNALLHLGYAAVSALSSCIDFLLKKDPMFEYESLEQVVRSGERYEQIIRFFDDEQIYQLLYYLGAALFVNGKTDKAKDIWWVVLKYDETGEWGIRSHKQFQEPFIEPLLNINEPY